MSTPLHSPLTGTTLSREETVRELLALLTTNIAAMEESRKHAPSPEAKGAAWVVISAHGIAIDYRVHGVTGHVGDPCPGKVHKVLRMSRDTAERLAAVTQDGTGEPMHAMHIADALDKELASLRELLQKAQAWARESPAA